MLEKTKVIPIIGINKILPLTIEIIATNPPKHNDPVSPIKTDALCVLNSKYPTSPPDKANDNTAMFLYSKKLTYKEENKLISTLIIIPIAKKYK